MSSAYVSNPVPKGTKTINDMFVSQDSSTYQANKDLPVRRLSTNKSSRRNLEQSDYGSFHENEESSGYTSSKTKSKKKFKSVSKQRTNVSNRRNIPKAGVPNFQPAHHDFDVNTVNDGLDEIDLLLDELANDIPEDLYENDDFNIEEMMNANRHLREKIGEISTMVISAISKAAILKRQIITHRDKPSDPEIGKKNKQITKYQVQITK